MTQAQPIDVLSATPPRARRRRIPASAGWLIALVSFLAVAPTLAWPEISNGIEQLHTATVLEMRREGGSWLMPTLNGTLRIKKPPLPGWIGAAAVSDRTVADASSRDRATRDAAFRQLAWEIRWPVLLAACLMLVATFDLASTLAGRRAAFWAALITATSLLFLRLTRLASTDVHLALWVTVANALLARAVFRRQHWHIATAGFAIGLAFMCKGPVALLQTLLPLLAAWPVLRRRTSAAASAIPPTADRRRRSLRLPIACSVLAFLMIALPWPIMVALSNEHALQIWWQEITREGATDTEYKPVWSYLSLLPNLLPWLPAFVLGCVLTLRPRRSPTAPRPVVRHRGYLLALLWLIVPIVVMSLVKDKAERYLLPLLPLAGIIAARGLLAAFAGIRRQRRDAGVLVSIHLVLVGAVALLLPMLGATPGGFLPAWLTDDHFTSVDGSTWYSPAVAAVGILFALAAAVGMGALVRRGRPAAATALAVLVIFTTHLLYMRGYRHSPDSQSEMRPIAEQILARSPDATVAYHQPDDGKAMPPDLAIYLNRVVRPLAQIRKRNDPEPDVIVMLQRKREDPPTLEGWRPFAVEPYRSVKWYAFEPAPAPN